jgi:hypothetical protein
MSSLQESSLLRLTRDAGAWNACAPQDRQWRVALPTPEGILGSKAKLMLLLRTKTQPKNTKAGTNPSDTRRSMYIVSVVSNAGSVSRPR